MRGHEPRGLDLAGKLAATETYVGITTDQDGAWRAYTSALIAFFDRPDHDRGDRRGPLEDGGRNAAPGAEEGAKDGTPRPLFAERLARRALSQGEKAQTLKDAAETLRAALSEEQIARLAWAEQGLVPRHGPRDGPHDGRKSGRPGPQGHHQRPDRPGAPEERAPAGREG